MTWETQAENKQEEVKDKMKVEFKSLLEAKKNRGIKILSYGTFSTGKTHFALSSNNKTFILDTENGASPLADKFPKAKVINICNKDNDDVEEKDEVKNFQNFMDIVNHLINLPDDQVGTIVVDSLTDIWSWCQGYCKVKVFKLNIEDRLKQRFDWGIINNIFKKVIYKLINKNCNLILTARESDIYDDASGPSGRVKPSTQKNVPYYVDVVLRHSVKFIAGKISFMTQIEKCRTNEKIIGRIIENLSLTQLEEMINKK